MSWFNKQKINKLGVDLFQAEHKSNLRLNCKLILLQRPSCDRHDGCVPRLNEVFKDSQLCKVRSVKGVNAKKLFKSLNLN